MILSEGTDLTATSDETSSVVLEGTDVHQASHQSGRPVYVIRAAPRTKPWVRATGWMLERWARQ